MQVEYPSQYLATMFCTQNTQQGVDKIIRGERGTISFSSASMRPGEVYLTPEEPFADEVKEETVGEQPRVDHDVNFIQCMRTRAKPHCDVLTGYKVMVALDLANRSYREGKMFHFDAERQRIV